MASLVRCDECGAVVADDDDEGWFTVIHERRTYDFSSVACLIAWVGKHGDRTSL